MLDVAKLIWTGTLSVKENKNLSDGAMLLRIIIEVHKAFDLPIDRLADFMEFSKRVLSKVGSEFRKVFMKVHTGSVRNITHCYAPKLPDYVHTCFRGQRRLLVIIV